MWSILIGRSLGSKISWDTYTMKIDSNGNKLWESKRGNPRGFNENYIHDEVRGVTSTWKNISKF